MATSTASTSRMNPHFPTTREGASSGAELFTLDGRTLPLVASTLRAEAQGGIARLVLEQAYVNSYAETLAVTYRMPLPAEGAVSGYAFEIAGRVVRGVVDRKQQARERFEQAIASGKTAALLEQERSDIFTQRIGNIPAGETIIARITIDQRLVWLPEGEWELRFPTVIGPRYCGTAETIDLRTASGGAARPGEPGLAMNDARATHVKVAPQDLGVRLQIELAIKDAISGGRKAASPSHQLAPQPDGTVQLSTGTRLDRDLVVRWPVATPAVGASLAIARPGETAEAFGLMTIVPPAKTAGVKPVPRDLLVLLDTSGSMGGGPLEKAKQVVAMLIDSLGETDRLELIEFSNNPRRYKDEPVMATAKAKADAIKWVRSRTADGGTEMRQAVIEALQTLRIGAQRQVVVVTDGYVGGEQQILRVLHDKLPASCRLHVLGVGSAVNRSLATALARAGRGAEVIVGIDEDAERGAKRLFDRTRMPVLTNVEIFGSALVRAVPEHIPDVFEGSPLLAALELRPEGGELTVRGQLAHDAWEQTVKVPATRVGDGNPALAALFGRERVADLEARSTLETVNAEIEALGLRFQIATRLTSWVAVDETAHIAPGPSRHEIVPQELPYGTSAAAFGLRGSAPVMAQEQFSVANSMKTMAGMISGKSEEDDAEEETAAPARVSMTRAGTMKGRMPMSAPPPAARAPEIDDLVADENIASLDEGDGAFGEAAPAELFGESEPTGVSTRTGGYGAGAPPAPSAPSAPRMQALPLGQPAQPVAKPEAAEPLMKESTRSSFTVGSVSPARGTPPAPPAPEPIAPMQAMPPKQAHKTRARVFMLLLLLAGIIAALIWGLLR